MEHRIFWLTPGQQAPIGATGITIPNTEGGILWIGESFPATATLGTKLPNDIEPETTYKQRLATKEEVAWYEDYLINPPKMDEDF